MKTVRVYRNPQCPKCARYAAWHRRFDWLGRVETTTSVPASGALAMGEVVVEDLRDGTIHHGADGFSVLAHQVPMYWPLLPLLHVSAIRRRVDTDMRGACDTSCEIRS
ncbi:MAG TPA: hypothetical protein VKB52_08615 [Rhodanobacteraceae bacterium]|nr:hypothetical protein [Rhodanobacteraceae bacterium]